jgi:hypothetical protein
MPTAQPIDAQNRSPNRRTRRRSQPTTAEPTANSSTHQNASEVAYLENAEAQEEHWRAYLLQLRRRACPGCGDGGVIF